MAKSKIPCLPLGMATNEATSQLRAGTVRIWLGKMCSPSTCTVLAAEDFMLGIGDHALLSSASMLRAAAEVNTEVQETDTLFPFGTKATELTSNQLHVVTAAKPAHRVTKPQPGYLKVF